jgi:hypothetical protein
MDASGAVHLFNELAVFVRLGLCGRDDGGDLLDSAPGTPSEGRDLVARFARSKVVTFHLAPVASVRRRNHWR